MIDFEQECTFLEKKWSKTIIIIKKVFLPLLYEFFFTFLPKMGLSLYIHHVKLAEQ